MRVLERAEAAAGSCGLRSGSDRVRGWRRMSARMALYWCGETRRGWARSDTVANEQPKMIEGEPLARDLRFALVVARFNDFVVEPSAARRARCVAAPRSSRQADRDRARAGRFRHPHRRAQAGAVAPLRGADHARRRDSRPDAAFRLMSPANAPAASRASRSSPACPSRSAFSPPTPWSRRWIVPAARPATRARMPRWSAIEMANLLRRLDTWSR